MLKQDILIMKRNKKIVFIALLCAIMLPTGSCKKLKTPEAVAQRENWYASFEDSVKFYQQQSEIIEGELSESNNKIGNMIQNFELVRKPREVSGYYILKGWGSKVPMESTGIYARINENESLELIATLSGGTFNQISIGNVSSDVVRHDQALNYRHATYNTVFFTGGKADTIAKYIADHENENLMLNFMENGVKKGSFAIPVSEKDMIARSWNLLSSQMETRRLQKELALSSRKIDTFRRMRDDREIREKKVSNIEN